MALEVTPGVLNDEVTDSVVQRHTTAALAGDRQGVCGAGDLEVSQQSTPGMGVRIGGGYGLVRGSASASQGMYSVFNDAPDESVAISPGDPSNPRNDIVGVQVQDHDFDGSTQRRARWLVVEGTPGAVPADPVLPASFLPLARVRVDQGESTSIVTADITDLRELAGDAPLRAHLDLLPARIRFGVTSATTDGSGDISVTHGLGATPTTVVATGRVSNAVIRVQSANSTTFSLRFLNPTTGAVLTSTALNFDWIAVA